MKVLITCPPMIGLMDEFRPLFHKLGFEVHCPRVVQTLSVPELVELVPQFDAWIIGDDPACREVLEAGVNGRLKAAVKWGVGVDNVDFDAAADLGLEITNTPNMFGAEVADIALSYVISLARETHIVNQGVHEGSWPKPRGMALAEKHVAVVGYGDVGRNLVKRLRACEMTVTVYDPYATSEAVDLGVSFATWPEGLSTADFIVFCCALTPDTHHMLNHDRLSECKHGVRIVNVARGPLIDENALFEALDSGQVHSAALEVFEVEPLPADSPLRRFNQCIFGAHNASNTEEGVRRTSHRAMELLTQFLSVYSNIA